MQILTKLEPKSRQNVRLQKTIKVLFLIGVVSVLSVFGYPFYQDSQKLNAYTQHYTLGLDVNPQGFLPADSNQLRVYAAKFERIFENHFPRNLAGDSSVLIPCDVEYNMPWDYWFGSNLHLLATYDPLDFNHPFNQVKRFYIGGHASVYAGYIMGGEGFRYAVAAREGNETERLECLSRILDFIDGYRIS